MGQRLCTSLNKAMATGIVYKKEKRVLSTQLNFITTAIWAMKRITLGLTQISRWSLIPHLPLHTHLKASLLKQLRNPGIIFMTGHILQAMCLSPHLLEGSIYNINGLNPSQVIQWNGYTILALVHSNCHLHYPLLCISLASCFLVIIFKAQ